MDKIRWNAFHQSSPSLTTHPRGSIPRQPTITTMKPILAIILLIAVILFGIWMDNHLPGFNPVETRMHP